MIVRDLIAPGMTAANMVTYPRMLARTNDAATVAESIIKPYSNYTFELVQAPLQTIAHLVKASRQIIDDAPGLASTIDSELR
jgi:HK97 family phage major capsid protein